MSAGEPALDAPLGPQATPRTTAGGWGGSLLTPRRSNIILALFLCAALPSLTAWQMPGLISDGWALWASTAVATVAAALALNVLMGYAGQISLGHAALLGVGAFTSGLLTSSAGFPLGFLTIPGGQSMLVGIPAAALVGALVALVIGFPALRLRGLYLAIVTIGFGFTMQDFVLRIPGLTHGSAGVELPQVLWPGLRLGGPGQAPYFLAIALVVLVMLWVIDVNIVTSRVGRAFHGIREDEAVAQSFAIDVPRYKLIAFVISGAMAGVAGALNGHAHLFTSNEQYTFLISLGLVITVVVGGLGSRLAVAIAAVFFTLFPPVLDAIHIRVGTADFHIDPIAGTVVGALLLILTVVQHPGGMAQVLAEARERRTHRAAEAAREALDDVDQVDGQVSVPKLPVLPRPKTHGACEEHSTVLRVADVTVRFGGLVAVSDANIEVARGKIVGLIGPNGAGKSTLFNAVSGFVRPESGSVILNGRDITRLGAHQRAALGVGRTFQNIGLAKNLTVLENFLLAQHQAGGYGSVRAILRSPRVARIERELEERSREAIAALGFDRFIDTPLRNLSHGQQRIVELGCVLVSDPDILLLDEPSAGMAPGAAENLAVRLRDLRDELGRTVLLIEHNVPLVLDVCDYIYVLSFGQVLAHGTTEMIARQPEVIAAYFGEQAA